ncbi:MAG: tryptophan synthase subunit alpha [bacterium]|nr:tryptophan synthase subunit alpha [bacterium]
MKNVFARKKSVFIPYITCGDPSLEKTEELITTIESAGADIIELGVPFSDPIADGPIIQAAYNRALKQEVSLERVIKIVEKQRKKVKIPIILLSYYNPIYKYGIERFVSSAKDIGISAVVIPDLPPEEAREIMVHSEKKDFSIIFFLAPTSTDKRIKFIGSQPAPFIYYVSITGITGVRDSLSSHLKERLQRIKALCKKPVAVGFGISNPSQAEEVAKIADGVIVGSAIVDIIGKNLSNPTKPVFDLVSSIASCVHRVKCSTKVRLK